MSAASEVSPLQRAVRLGHARAGMWNTVVAASTAAMRSAATQRKRRIDAVRMAGPCAKKPPAGPARRSPETTPRNAATLAMAVDWPRPVVRTAMSTRPAAARRFTAAMAQNTGTALSGAAAGKRSIFTCGITTAASMSDTAASRVAQERRERRQERRSRHAGRAALQTIPSRPRA